MNNEYREVLRHLVSLDDEAAAHRSQAHEWYAAQVATAQGRVQDAEDDVRDAGHDVREARRQLEEVDARTAELWSEFVHRMGPAAERYGRTKPGPTIPRQRDRDVQDYLEEASTAVAWTPPARPVTGGTRLQLAALGAGGGLLAAGLYQALRWLGERAGGDLQVALPVIGLVAMLLGPVLAIVAAARVLHRRVATMTFGTASTVLATSLLTIVVALAWVRAGQGH